jgi:hypothetical protein
MSILSRRNIFIWLALFLLTSGCARFVMPDMPLETVIPAESQLARLSGINKGIPPYKGVGELSFISDRGAWSMRGAWMGVPDNLFRVETIGVVGQPGARLICDGDQCHFLYSEDGCLRKISSREKNLRPLAGIDMDVSDLVLLLGGGVPIVPHDAAWMEDTPEGPVLKLNRRFYGRVERIYFTPDMTHVYRVEIFGVRGLRYRAEIASTQMVDGYEAPDVLWVEDDSASMALKVDRAWFDVDYSPEAFVPQMPETGRCN